MTKPVRFLAILTLGYVSFACLGCGPREMVVTGTVTNGGAPLPLSKRDSLVVSFVPEDRPGDSFSASTKPDGSFAVYGIRRKGILPGKYRISVAVMPDRGEDRLGGKFSQSKAPFIREIASDKEPIILDISKPPG